MITELMCLATAIFFEARDQPYDGQVGVAQVIINRKNHRSYPDTICGVVQEDRGPKSYDCQFSFYCDGLKDNPEEYKRPSDMKAWGVAQEIAEKTLRGNIASGVDMTGVTLYHSTQVDPYWAKHYVYHGKIGDHMFYTNERTN